MKRQNPFDKYIKGETALHIAVCEYVAYQYPEILIHHSPNEGKRTPFERYLIKRMNVSSGFPDLMLVDVKQNKILYLELKFGKNKLTANQSNWLKSLSLLNNVKCDTAWHFNTAIDIIDNYFKT